MGCREDKEEDRGGEDICQGISVRDLGMFWVITTGLLRYITILVYATLHRRGSVA